MNGINISKIKILETIKKPAPGHGVYSFICREIELPRPGTCLKIFRHLVKDPDNFIWGLMPYRGSNIIEATKIQNLYAFADLAPRVYRLLLAENNGNQHYVQIVDDLGTHDFSKNREGVRIMNKKLKAFADANEIEYFDDGQEKNFVNGKWVDFQGYKFKDGYEKKLKQKVDTTCNWHPPSSYQGFKKLGLKGRRDNYHRVKAMKLNEIDFKGKTVLDFGCSAGWFCNYADMNGASRVVGIDWFGRADVARELSNYLGYFNNDYYEMDLKAATTEMIQKVSGLMSFDIVLYLSMSYHIGMPDYVFDLTKGTLVYEGNSRDNDKEFEMKIRSKMKNTVKVGETNDLYPRRVLWANR